MMNNDKPTRYYGKVCDKHPNLNGMRLSSNSRCISCRNEIRHASLKRRYHEDEEYKKKYLKRRSEQKARKNNYALYAANYRARLVNRTPKWADIKKIKDIYKEAYEKGMTVDHYYPLKGGTVSGLHVETNLVIITQKENDTKSNKHPDEFYER